MRTAPYPDHQAARTAYEHIAPFYDAFTAHHDYELWLERLLGAAAEFGLRGRRLLDVACGTGKSFLPLLDSGWQVTGCDISEAMLERAREKAGSRAELIAADMRELPRLGSFDLVLCLDDAINYLLSVDELESCLCALGRNLDRHGLLVFDTNTLHSYRTFFAETQSLDVDGQRLTWRGHASPVAPRGTTISATFEVQPPNGRPSSALHWQRHFPPAQIERALARAGLDCLAVFGHGYDARLERPLDEARHTKAIFIAGRK